MKYFIYCRKSSESEDRQVLSIPSQISELKELAKKNNLSIVRVFTESQSAKAPSRLIFNEMMQSISEGKANGILCWKLDRLVRNPVDGGSIQWMLQNGVINHIKTPERDYRTGDNVLIMSVEFGMANQFILDLRKNTQRGLKTKVENGWYPALAPLGYLNNKYENKGEKDIVKDPERFRLIRKIWDMALTRVYTPSGILEETKKWGLHTRKTKRLGGKELSLSAIYKILHSPFYYGKFKYSNIIYQGSHEKMITEDEFWTVQKILGRKGIQRPQNHEFSYTGMIKCGKCGCAITAESKVKSSSIATHNYTYYRCTRKSTHIPCSQKAIEIKDLEKQIYQILSEIEISDKFKQWALKNLNKANDDEIKTRMKLLDSQQNSYKKTQREIDNLTQMRFREQISDEEYLRYKRELTKKLDSTKVNLNKTDARAYNWRELAENTFKFANKCRTAFEEGSLKDRKLILQTIGSNFILKDKILHLEIQKPYLIIRKGLQDIQNLEQRLEPVLLGSKQQKRADLTPLYEIWGDQRESNSR